MNSNWVHDCAVAGKGRVLPVSVKYCNLCEVNMPQAQSDPVNHPAHYTSDPSGVECIAVTRHRNFNVGNAMKYLWRAGLKAPFDASVTPAKSAENNLLLKQIEDLKKARWYIADEIARLGGTP